MQSALAKNGTQFQLPNPNMYAMPREQCMADQHGAQAQAQVTWFVGLKVLIPTAPDLHIAGAEKDMELKHESRASIPDIGL